MRCENTSSAGHGFRRATSVHTLYHRVLAAKKCVVLENRDVEEQFELTPEINAEPPSISDDASATFERVRFGANENGNAALQSGA